MEISWEDLVFFLYIINKEGRILIMLKSIYKITNNINGKCYIGQTSNIKRRFREHKEKVHQDEKKVLYYAFDKYGIENFTFEVLEENIENYNEREKYWIRYYDSFENGYNMTPGGEEPPVNKGANSPFLTHSVEEADHVIDLILNSNKSFLEIAEETGYSHSTVLRINKGILWHKEEYDYPLRKEHSKKFLEDRFYSIVNDLKNTNMTHKEIAAKNGCAKSTVTMINIGKNHYHPDIDYPIRKNTK